MWKPPWAPARGRRPQSPKWGFAPLVAVAGLAAVTLAGCPDTDPAVFIEADITNLTVAVAEETLGTTISGSFSLDLHLGPRASGPGDVDLGAFSVTDAGGTNTLVPVLAVQTTPGFPVTVPVDGDVTVAVRFEPEDNFLDAAAFDALCGAGGLVVVGALDDSLRGGTISVSSDPTMPSGCP